LFFNSSAFVWPRIDVYWSDVIHLYSSFGPVCAALTRSLKKRKKVGKERKEKSPQKNKLNKKATWSNSLTLMTKVSRSKSSYVYEKELNVFIYITDIQKSVQVNKINGLVI